MSLHPRKYDESQYTQEWFSKCSIGTLCGWEATFDQTLCPNHIERYFKVNVNSNSECITSKYPVLYQKNYEGRYLEKVFQGKILGV